MNILKEKIKLTTREILLSMLNFSEEIMEPYYKRHRGLLKDYYDYKKWRKIDKNNYYQKLWRLKKQGYIERFKKDKKNLLKLTKVGHKKALKYALEKCEVKKPKTWDKKWRIVVFDIPEEKKNLRNVIRLKLKNLGFFQLQKSVWVHPYGCKEIIDSLKYVYNLNPYIQYIIAETIETEINLVDYFLEQKTLDLFRNNFS